MSQQMVDAVLLVSLVVFGFGLRWALGEIQRLQRDLKAIRAIQLLSIHDPAKATAYLLEWTKKQ